MKTTYTLTSDPLFYVMAGFFAFLTTGLPAVLGQVRFLPIIQAISFTIFLGITLRRGRLKNSLLVTGVWLAVQVLTMTVLTWFATTQVERAISDGFLYRTAYIEWFLAGSPLPRSLAAEPMSRAIELLGIILGSLFTGGLIGAWFFMRAVNLAAYAAGSLLLVFDGIWALLAAFPIWIVLRVPAYAGLVILFAEPLWTGTLSPLVIWRRRRRLVLSTLLLLLLAHLLELYSPDLWRSVFL